MQETRELDAATHSTSQPTPSPRTLRGLDWLNFLLADVQTGVGPFLAIYLAGHKWNEERVGLALTVGGQRLPSGCLCDVARDCGARGIRRAARAQPDVQQRPETFRVTAGCARARS